MPPPGDAPCPDTHFAPAGRATVHELEAQVEACLQSPLVKVILESLDSLVMILNEQRQFLAGNQALLEAMRRDHPECFQGLRPGEAFNCVHVGEGPDGCGTSEACRQCGAVIAILASQASGAPVSGECHLSRQVDGVWVASDFSVRATPLEVGPHRLQVFVLRDIASEKRRELLERVFLHDLTNHLHGLHGWIEVLQAGQDPLWTASKILEITDRLTQDVKTQNLLLEAEQGSVRARPSPQAPSAVLDAVVAQVSRHPACTDRRLEALPAPSGAELHVDGPLLGRVLANMALNGVEAARPGERVSLEYLRTEDGPLFRVANPGCIPEAVAVRIFQRAFTTKGARGRGLGTWSMKLLGENVLGGKVSFTTHPVDGTVFTLRLPASSYLDL